MCSTISNSSLPGTGNATTVAAVSSRKKRDVEASHIRKRRAAETEKEIEDRSYGANLRYNL